MNLKKPDLPLLVFSLCALIFVAVGARRAFQVSYDFVPVYTGARCLLHSCDPYDTAQLQKQFFAAGGRSNEQPFWNIDVPVYPPSTFLVLAPLALLRYSAARVVWFSLNASLLITSSALIISMCPRRQRWPATLLASFVLATSGILLVLGQPAAFAISLLIVSTYFFLQGRHLPAATGLLLISLAVKPQIGGLVALYMVLARVRARYAAFALAGSFLVLVVASLIFHARPESADWLATLRANLASTVSPGGSADPRPANEVAVGDINLQTITSIFFAETASFNTAAYAVFGVLLLALTVVVMDVPRSTGMSPEMHFMGIAATAILSLTPVYHRFYDSRLLLLTIPATVLVFEKRRALGFIMAALTVLGVVSIQYRVQAYLLSHGQWDTLLHHRWLFVLVLRQQNLELLCLFALCLAAIQLESVAAPSELFPR